jgi:hypothetical protein
VRLIPRKSGLLLALALFFAAAGARAQNPDTIAPEESEARAKRILNQLVEAMGGPAYLGMNGRQCDGRRALIGHNGELSGYIGFKDSWQFPDKNRIDYVAHSRNTLLGYIIGVQDLDITKGGLVITLYSGDHGWIMDRGGVSEMPESTVAQFEQALKQNPDNLLRRRIREEGVRFRWGGLDTVDLRPVDWVEITDKDGNMVRLAVDRSSHLVVRSQMVTQDEELRQPREDVIIYSNYHVKGGVQVPMQITRERDGRRISQVFYDECTANPALAPDFFTRQGLEKRFKETGGKVKSNQ